MGISDYRVWVHAPQIREVGDQNAEKFNVGVHAIAKRSLINDFEIANEILGLRLGQSLNLPVPEGVPLRFNDTHYFSSLIIAGTGQKLPPADVELFVQRHPGLALGTLVFDAWICHEDRHDENLAFLEAATPSEDRIWLYDHGMALFGQDGIERMLSFENRLPGYTDLTREIRTFVGFDDWESRIQRVSDIFIRDAVAEAAAFTDLSASDIHACANFLVRRRTQLRQLFAHGQDDRTLFPRLNATMFRICEDDNPEPEYQI